MVVETQTLINTVKKMYPVAKFFKDRYFPDGRTFYSEKALIEMKKGTRKIAPFVVPVVNGIPMESEGYSAYEVKAPYIALKMPITQEELQKKAFGESIESNRKPEDREKELEAEHMDDMRRAIYNRQELMCTEIITTGQIVMKHYSTAEDAAKGTNYKQMLLRFYSKEEFKNKYKFVKKWGEMTTSEKIQEFYKMAAILKRRGVKAVDLDFASDVSMDLMTDKEFLEFYNKLHVNTGVIDQKELPDGVTNNGKINVNGVIFDMYTYDEVYEDADGTIKEFLPKGTIAMLHPNMGTTVYAQVTLVKGGTFKSFAERIVPRVVASEDNNMMEVQMLSRPVPYPYDCDGWLVANIHDDIAKSQNDADNSVDTDEPAQSGVTLKSEAEIKAMNKKADVIAYAESIGLSGLSTDMKLEDLYESVLIYQNETYSD